MTPPDELAMQMVKVRFCEPILGNRAMDETTANMLERTVQTSETMTIASVMVHVDFDAQSDNRIRIASDMASKFGAVLIGVAGWPPGREEGGWFATELKRPEERNDRILAELDNPFQAAG